MKVESIAECSTSSILQYFWPALSDNLSWNLIFGLSRVVVLHMFYCIQLSNFFWSDLAEMMRVKSTKGKVMSRTLHPLY